MVAPTPREPEYVPWPRTWRATPSLVPRTLGVLAGVVGAGGVVQALAGALTPPELFGTLGVFLMTVALSGVLGDLTPLTPEGGWVPRGDALLAPARTPVVVADAFLLLTGLAWLATCGVFFWTHDQLVGVGLVAVVGAVAVARVVRERRGRGLTVTPTGFLAGEGPLVPWDSVTTVRIPALNQGRQVLVETTEGAHTLITSGLAVRPDVLLHVMKLAHQDPSFRGRLGDPRIIDEIRTWELQGPSDWGSPRSRRDPDR